MMRSLLANFLLTPIFILVAVFLAGITPPIGTNNSKSATSQVIDLTILILNLEMGVSYVAVMGWRISSLKSAEIEEQCLDCHKQIQEKEVQIKAVIQSLHSQIKAN
ncbi:MAG TPA: hypothetical protein DEG17_16440 [Cyanobacteria bacterium UBA11149]|nr:hypothetical protein [Cyanobacteria bacterium UBA11367]HBE57609.1 hypothetical protein [Cyanobacteria bacterium UBA11366]HBK65399.1 hypothetical protein [Cyanobacteria bacterium UBA11166]HBR74051.1 hypothetical protein [Cyanobacteria bacterium UBA11159]HBS69165.1 hypothetical protein [Cyanobacteria bacterium UBA11153]HBW90413.1 hypothetical protein [Cyanobacteria bacterium UBA11149]HCA93792.1 hypothetical protein [Cyanobacteria bacterium UBA9226]